MSQKNVFPTGSSVLDQYVIATRGTAQFGDNSNNYLVGVTPTTYNTYQVATVGNINNFGLTPQNNTGSSTGTYYSNGVSAMRIPADSSANRPPTGYAGYIRYNTNNNYIEYYNSNTTAWLPISQQSPVITNVTPSYISQDTSFNVYSITGSNFSIVYSTVYFVGVNDSQTYTTSTVVNSGTSITATASYALSDVSSNPTGYFLVVKNLDTGLSYQYGSIISFDPAPTWSTPSGTLGSSYSNLTFTTANSPFTPLVATDPNTPVTYYYSTPPVGTTITLDASTGILIGTTPTVTSTTTYNFYAIAKDGLAVPAISVPRLFSFTILTTLANITGSAIYSVGYTDANGQNYSATTPISGGYTVYWFTAASGATFTTSSYTPPYITYLVVGGGGGGGGGDSGGSGGGGGGAGGVLTGILSISASTGYTVTVGTGGAGGSGSNFGGQGADTTFGSIVASGGGGGGNNFVAGVSSQASGGGGGWRNLALGGSGNTSSTNPPQGNAGGNALLFNTASTGRGGGGGGAMMAGVNGSGNNANAYNATSTPGGTGGNGLNFTMVQGTTIPGAATGYGGGGGGGGYDRPAGLTYIGGGGAGALQTGSGSSSTINGNPATANTGGGGGGASTGGSAGTSIGGTGSQGFILLRHLTVPISNTLATYTIGSSGYTISYVNNANAVVGSATVGGYTIISFPAASLVNQVIPTSTTNNYQAASSATKTYTFTPTSTMGPVAYLIVGGGGGGGCRFGGGGGAGGVIYGYATLTNGTAYTITVGAGGAGGATDDTAGVAGSSSSISSSGGGTTTAYGGGGGNSENKTATGSTFGSGGGGSYATSTYSTPGSGYGGQGFNGGYGNNSAGVGRNGGGGGGAGGPGGAGSTTIGYASGTASNPETQLDSYAYGAPYGGQAIGLSITGTLTAYGGGGGGCDMRQDTGASMGYGGGGGINYTSSSSLGLGYPSGTYYLTGSQSAGYGCYGVFGGGGNTNSNANISGGRGGGSNGNSAQGASGSCYYSSGVGEAGRHGTGGGGGGGAYMTTALTYNPNSIAGGQPGGAGGAGIVILRFPSYIC